MDCQFQTESGETFIHLHIKMNLTPNIEIECHIYRHTVIMASPLIVIKTGPKISHFLSWVAVLSESMHVRLQTSLHLRNESETEE